MMVLVLVFVLIHTKFRQQQTERLVRSEDFIHFFLEKKKESGLGLEHDSHSKISLT